ncbi:MAG: DUF6702 family protein [Planctomycetota bacterium]
MPRTQTQYEIAAKLARFAAIFVCLVGIAAAIQAASPTLHPFHISVAELEFNAKSKRVEVSLKLHSTDMDNALSADLGKRVDVEKDKVDKELTKYLEGHFYLLPESAAKAEEVTEKTPLSKVHFVGKELDKGWLWVYFEMELPKTDEPLALVNTVFLDRIKDQINTVSVRANAKRESMKMTRKKLWHPFDRAWLAAKK